MTGIDYIDISIKKGTEVTKKKLEGDYKDIGMFPEIQQEIEPLYKAWQKLLDVYPEH